MKRKMTIGAMVTFIASGGAQAGEATDLGDMVVTAPAMSAPLQLELDPKAASQPLPAADGASFLKNIAGFSVARQGGTDGEVALRGLGGSRLNILQDGGYVWGGCPNRMDPPTAYIYPESFDKVTVTKGPQSVIYGGGAVAGTVSFERDTEQFSEAGRRFHGSLLVGSHGRNDQIIDATAGDPNAFFRLVGTRSDADDYQDGDDNEIHSAYTRWSGTAIAGLTPDEDTRIQITAERSDGEAAYANRPMDGVVFDREGFSVDFRKERVSEVVRMFELKAYHTYIDHVMDNYTLREPNGMKMVSNPDRATDGVRTVSELALGENVLATIGVDHQSSQHRARKAMGMMGVDPVLPAREDDASFSSSGLFAELEHELTLHDRVVWGARVDYTRAEAEKESETFGGATAGTTETDTNLDGFVRYERELDGLPTLLYAGVGHAERSADYWERDKAFYLDPERNTQLDMGLQHNSGRVRSGVSLFYSEIADYILITDNGNNARNVDATLYGAEAEVSYGFATNWELRGTLAYVRGENDSDNVALAQMPPAEVTVDLRYDDSIHSAGINIRGVARQDRVDEGNGTIYGTDIGETAGFGVVSLHTGYRPNETLLFTAGIDNLLDRTYAEHLARGSADAGTVTGRVNEPGRTWWLKANASF